MKVLVATHDGQGELPDDFCWTTDGELAHLLECPDEMCECWGAFGGFESLRATTTALVVERSDLDVAKLVTACKERLTRQGYAELFTPEELDREVLAEVFELIRVLEKIEVGTVVERTSEGVRARCRAA